MDEQIKESLHQVVGRALAEHDVVARGGEYRRAQTDAVVGALLKDYDVRAKDTPLPDHPLRWTKAIDILHTAIFGAAPWDNVMASDEAHALIRKGLESLEDNDIELADNYMVVLHRERAVRKSWRGRRLQACRAADGLHAVIGALGVDDGTDSLNLHGGAYPLDPAIKEELANQVATLLRMVLLMNDGNVSPQKLQRF